MKNFKFLNGKKCSVFSLIYAALFLIFSIFPAVSLLQKSQAKSFESSTISPFAEPINYTVFIKNATYSVAFDDKVFFIDKDIDYNSRITYYLKAYSNGVFDSKYVVLDELKNIIDVAYIDGNFIILTETGIFKLELNLEEKHLTKIEFTEELVEDFDYKNYCAISTYKYTKDSTEYFLMLTPTDFVDSSSNEVLPLILIFSEEFSFTTKVEINYNYSSSTNDEKLLRFFIIDSSENDEMVNLLFVYNVHVCYLRANKSELNDSFISGIEINSFKNNLSSFSNQTFKIYSSNILFIDDASLEGEPEPYLLINYGKTSDGFATASQLYKISISSSDLQSNTDISSVYQFASYNGSLSDGNSVAINYPITTENKLFYASDQSIFEVTITKNENYKDETNPITNPDIEISYYDINSNGFIYSQTTTFTYLLNKPWSSSSELESRRILTGEDVIVIGEGKISKGSVEAVDLDPDPTEDEKMTIEDYKYCLYTSGEKNYLGYIKAEDLTSKQQLVESEKLTLNTYTKILRVKPNTALYSLPTKVLNDKITSSLTSSLVSTIKDNSRVELLDQIYDYKSNNSIFLKVKVNNAEEGYIEYDSLIHPSDSKDFILTNSSIKEDGTNVYLEANTSSPVISTLNKAKRVRINGVRNTKTGFTYITFNDEYGNEFSGYIVTDSIKSDSWSTLQIIGFILIAINIGLLILIIYFRDTRIGENALKYDRSKTSNAVKKDEK